MQATDRSIPPSLVRAGVTPRESEVLAAVATRLSNPEIAEQLVISLRTVESHVSSLLRKTRAANRRELIAIGLQAGRPARPSILPEPVTTFVGRVQELAELEQLVREARLVTIVGPGGVGKTRLALRAAARLAQVRPDGVAMVDLAALTSGAQVLPAVARSLGVPEQGDRPIAATLADAIHHHDVLLIIDNCEHVIDDVAACVTILLTASDIRILATSREPLGAPGETSYPLDPLGVPAAPRPATRAEPATGDAVQLFADRARSADPAFSVTDDNADAVGELCRRLDGLPLALELAAARMRVFSVDQLVAHLDRRFDLLTSGERTAPDRHRTLLGTIRWSHDRLDDEERLLFERLGVFAGTFDYEAIDMICGTAPLGSATVLTAFPRLLDASLVGRHRSEQDERYRLLESIRHFARQQLPTSTADDLHRRHAQHYLELAEAACPRLRGADQDTWLSRLAADEANLLAALVWVIERGDQTTALRWLSALATYWDDTGQRQEAGEWIRKTLALGDPPATSASVTALADASFLLLASDVERGLALAEVAVERARELEPGDRATANLALGWALAYNGRRGEATAALRGSLTYGDGHPWHRATGLQGLALATDDLDVAIGHAREAVSLFRHLGDRRRLANALYTMADGALNAGRRLDEARTWLDESLALSRAMGSDHDLAHAQLGHARLGLMCDQPQEVERLLDECMPALRRLGDCRCTGRALCMLGELAVGRGDHARATDLLTESVQAAGPSGDDEILRRAQQALLRLR